MKALRRRKIAKQYGVVYKRYINKNANFHYFKKKGSGFGFYHCNNLTFLNVVKNKHKWDDFNFEHRK
ncbi:hypothetical protein ACOMCU_27965 [Lysinibacillus sp. UGB7]|uniref:hypothetical protein n=1 Tax=Lysinibacillus sp. UGB7 TaxID=3411039 RepID=UPI003B7D6FC4